MDAGYFGMLVDCRGRTGLSTRYPEPSAPVKMGAGGGSTGLYSMRKESTRSRARACNRILAHLGVGRRVYMITQTCSPEFTPHDRRAMWRKLVDRVRKEPGMFAYQWMTELHLGERAHQGGDGRNRGTIHHHMVMVMQRRWDYAPLVKDWSMRYAGSINGLDIRRMDDDDAAGYILPNIGYINPDEGADQDLPFRWWGVSQMKRQVLVQGPVEGVMARDPYRGGLNFRMSYEDAAKLCAKGTERMRAERLKRMAARKAGRPAKARTKYETVETGHWSDHVDLWDPAQHIRFVDGVYAIREP